MTMCCALFSLVFHCARIFFSLKLAGHGRVAPSCVATTKLYVSCSPHTGVTKYAIVENCGDSQNMTDRATHEYPDGTRGMCRRVMNTCSIIPSSARVHLNWCHAGMRCMPILKACVSIVLCFRKFSPNTLATAGQVPHVALIGALVCWMVLATIRDQTSPNCWHHHVLIFASTTTPQPTATLSLCQKWVLAIHA